MNLVELKKAIRSLASQSQYGIMAAEVEGICGCSREWARQVLERMEKEGTLRVRRYGPQAIVYFLND